MSDKLSPADTLQEFPRLLGRSITYLHRQRNKFMGERLKPYGFIGAMHMILLYIARNPGTTQDAIVSHMYIDKCNVARRTKRLEELGYIRRETGKTDRRENNLYLTEAGEELAPYCRECAGHGPLHPYSAAGANECTRRFWR